MSRILVIEDEAGIRANLRRFLQLEGYDVLEAETGRRGLELARSGVPDLILCDLRMPELDGFAVLRSLRRDPITAAIPFLFVTASAEKDNQRLGMQIGADGYIAKPFNLAELRELIAAQLRRT